MLIHDGDRRLETHCNLSLYIMDTQWKDDLAGGWVSQEMWCLDRKRALRLQEDIRQFLKENPE